MVLYAVQGAVGIQLDIQAFFSSFFFPIGLSKVKSYKKNYKKFWRMKLITTEASL